MTNRDRILALIEPFTASENAVNGAMIDAGVVADDDYTLANQPAVRNAARMILEGIKVSSVSEGGYSISYDKEALERQIASLSGGGRPKVRALNVW